MDRLTQERLFPKITLCAYENGECIDSITSRDKQTLNDFKDDFKSCIIRTY